MTNYRNEFITWYFNEFHADRNYLVLNTVVEDSPWHRERSAAAHTDMVVTQYLARAADQYWAGPRERQFLLGAFAAAWHDTGKYWRVQHKESEQRGKYKSFVGHEIKSARMWENWAVKNWPMLQLRFGMGLHEMYDVGWMIEHHLPWGLKDQRKVFNLTLNALRCGIGDAFSTLLMSDQAGRISDDADAKYIKAQTWVDGFNDRLRGLAAAMPEQDRFSSDLPRPTTGQPQLVMPIAASGAGKTSLFKLLYQDSEYAHFSLDEMRLLWAGQHLDIPAETDTKTLYSICWGYCHDHEADFRKYWQKEFTALVKSGQNIFVDGTNLGSRKRRFFLAMAESHGYWLTAWLLPTTLRTLQDRQLSRSDKGVPDRDVRQQYDSLQLPSFGEFHDINIRKLNLDALA